MIDMKLKIVFFGTPEFAAYNLSKILDSGYDVRAVVTMPDKVAGRGHKLLQSDVKKIAVERNLPVLQPANLKDEAFLNELRSFDANLFVVIAFRMLPQVVWQMPELGTFNLHASLLPRFRGAAPINRAIMAGDKKSGVTTFFLKHEIDTGDIIGREEVDILPEDNAGTLHDKLMHLGASMVVDTLKSIEDGTVNPQPQPEGEFLPAPKIFKVDCKIDWNCEAEDIHNHIRGLSPYPAAWATVEDAAGTEVDVKIFASALTDSPKGLAPGEVYIQKGRLWVGTASSPIEILSLQPAGKKQMPANAYLLGYHPSSFK
jgi:methionyl-tRNA formyltransferase